MAPLTKSAPLVALIAFISFAPATAQAQDERLRISFAPAMAASSGNTELALGGSVGYRFLDRVWFEGEFTWIDGGAGGLRSGIFSLDGRSFNTAGVVDLVQRQFGLIGRGTSPGTVLPGRPGIPILPNFPIDIGSIRATTDGNTMIGTMGVRYELPAQGQRFRPYLAAGLGINRTDQDLEVERTILTPAFDADRSHTGFAFSAGGGASVRLAGQLWADADAKYFRLSNDRNIMRLGGGVSFRF
jgi:opacity protein-like surface antigen